MSTLSSAGDAALDRAFHALSDATRRGMIDRLARGPATISELAAPFAISLPTVMKHVRVLEESGIVLSEKSGRVRTCRIAPRALAAVEGWVAKRRRSYEASFDRLGEVLKNVRAAKTGKRE